MKTLQKTAVVVCWMVMLAGCGEEIDQPSSPTMTLAFADPFPESSIDEGDLLVGWISRSPVLSYVHNAQDPSRQGWPVEGSTVTWQAHVRNTGAKARNAVNYLWRIDGAVIEQGTFNVAGQSSTVVEMDWVWSFTRHGIEFEIDPAGLVPEFEKGNNTRKIESDALAVGFWVEQSLYQYFNDHQDELKVHSNSWEDWANRQMDRWNQILAKATYPDSPAGVLDRVRLDKVVVVPDGALPLNGGLPSNDPATDSTVDLMWGFEYGTNSLEFYKDHTSVADNNPFYYEGSLFHEVGHARYLIDLYGFNLHDTGSGDSVGLFENGALVIGSAFMPLQGDMVHPQPRRGLMDGDYTKIDDYSAVALNLIAGHRATMGNQNAPGNLGVFLNDLPAENMVTLVDADSGAPLSGAQVRLYRAQPKDNVWYGKRYSNSVYLSLTADASGRILTGQCPFSASGSITHGYGFSNGLLILRVALGQKIGYGFLDVTEFNMEYWRGHVTEGHYTVQVPMVDSTVTQNGCGDGTCQADETCSTCPVDCGPCGSTCGDGSCQADETCSTCPADCGPCGSTCGDGNCQAGETCATCPGDCGSCQPGVCPCVSSYNNFCHHPPQTSDCPMTSPGGYCDPNGDGSYTDADWNRGWEDYQAQCSSSCGDGSCQVGETCASCPSDCGDCQPGSCPCVTGFSNFCHHPPQTTGCPMTSPGGYCDSNGDGSYTDANWTRGWEEYQASCG